jgi:hypothetical protein
VNVRFGAARIFACVLPLLGISPPANCVSISLAILSLISLISPIFFIEMFGGPEDEPLIEIEIPPTSGFIFICGSLSGKPQLGQKFQSSFTALPQL